MNIHEFSTQVEMELERNYFPKSKGFEINRMSITKDNDTKLHGLNIRHKSQQVAPTFYLDNFLGNSPAATARKIATKYEKCQKDERFNIEKKLSDFFNFDKSKQKICYRLINEQFNHDYLQDKPSIPVAGDLRAVFYVDVSPDATITITDELTRRWGIDDRHAAQILYDYASKNTERLKPVKLQTLSEIIFGFFKEDCPDADIPSSEDFSDMIKSHTRNTDAFVLSNSDTRFGASVMLYQNGQQLNLALQEINRRTNQNFTSVYILPSSVHELLIIPDNGYYEIEELQAMVTAVNETEVAPNEFLSNQIYHYNKHTGLRMITSPERSMDIER